MRLNKPSSEPLGSDATFFQSSAWSAKNAILKKKSIEHVNREAEQIEQTNTRTQIIH
jgi:hypothetical protein